MQLQLVYLASHPDKYKWLIKKTSTIIVHLSQEKDTYHIVAHFYRGKANILTDYFCCICKPSYYHLCGLHGNHQNMLDIGINSCPLI